MLKKRTVPKKKLYTNGAEMERILRYIIFKKQRNKEKRGSDAIPKTPDNLDIAGAGERIRTAGFLITSEILYQLSYAGC